MWHVCRPWLFEVYIVLIVPAMLVCAQRLIPKRSILAGLTLSVASFTVVMWFPIGAIAWMIIEGLTIGENAKYSLLNGISFAPLMALCGASVSAVVVRFVFREHIGKREFAQLYIWNLLPIALAISAILILLAIHPPQFIA